MDPREVGNYGVAIILLTLGIRIVLFPLMHTSTVSMRKMQKVQPKVKAIQEKYKKNKTDPQVRAKMNQEMMELYKAEGVNPMGGCLPLLVQLPILWALYTLFAHAIELRHAPFMLWIVGPLGEGPAVHHAGADDGDDVVAAEDGAAGGRSTAAADHADDAADLRHHVPGVPVRAGAVLADEQRDHDPPAGGHVPPDR